MQGISPRMSTFLFQTRLTPLAHYHQLQLLEWNTLHMQQYQVRSHSNEILLLVLLQCILAKWSPSQRIISQSQLATDHRSLARILSHEGLKPCI
jgi:hypothetical protein